MVQILGQFRVVEFGVPKLDRLVPVGVPVGFLHPEADTFAEGCPVSGAHVVIGCSDSSQKCGELLGFHGDPGPRRGHAVDHGSVADLEGTVGGLQIVDSPDKVVGVVGEVDGQPIEVVVELRNSVGEQRRCLGDEWPQRIPGSGQGVDGVSMLVHEVSCLVDVDEDPRHVVCPLHSPPECLESIS